MQLKPSPSAASISPKPGVRTHDGFYLRLASGFGGWSESLNLKDRDVYDGRIFVRTTGIASIGSLEIGGNITRKWVLAGSIQGADLLASNSHVRTDSVQGPPVELNPELRSLILLGILAQWYPDPTRGLHFGGGLSLAGLAVDDNDEDAFDEGGYSAGGLGITAEVGNLWWIAEQWSVGARARGTALFAGGEDEAGAKWEHALSISPGILFDVVYH